MFYVEKVLKIFMNWKVYWKFVLLILFSVYKCGDLLYKIYNEFNFYRLYVG